MSTTGKILALRVEGHAGYAKVGEDIVCASASILAFTLAQCVAEAEHKYVDVGLASGDAFICCEPTDKELPRMQNAFAFAKTGYALLAHEYPQCVEITDAEDLCVFNI